MWDDALIEYTNVFRSRIAHGNLVARHNDNRQKDLSIIERRIQGRAFRIEDISSDDKSWKSVITYLVDKGFLGKKPKKSGRYKGMFVREESGELFVYRDDEVMTKIPITLVDAYFSDLRVRSTVGVPTSENLGEAVGASIDFGFCNKRGQNLRLADLMLGITSLVGQSEENPYVVDKLDILYFYSIIRSDFFVFLSICQRIRGESEFDRNDMIHSFPEVVNGAVGIAERYFPRRSVMRTLKKYSRLMETSLLKFGDEKMRGPGVLEHRLTPRLEFLVDIGFLRKNDKRNSFSYHVEDSCKEFVERIHGTENKLDFINVMRAYIFSRLGGDVPIDFSDIARVYNEIGPRVGSISIEHLAIAVLSVHRTADVQSFFDSLFAKGHEKYVRFTGGRYNRSAEYVWIDTKSVSIT